jgi:hypothetical protein
MDINKVKFGISLSVQTLRSKITASGWTIKKVKFDSKLDRYTASAKNEHGEDLERNGKTEELALANLLTVITQRNSSYLKLARWQTTFTDQLQPIAEAYMKAPVYDVKAAQAFLELARDSERRAEVLQEHLRVQVVNDPEPYKNSQQLVDDVRKKRQLLVSRAGIDHPVWSDAQVIAYRICHDVLGYAAADAGWDWAGENLAFAHHAELLSEEAQKALFCESVASTAYAAFYRAYSPEKVALFPQFMNKAQEFENPGKGHPGIHPSQSFPAVPLPAVKPVVEAHLGSWGFDDSEALQRVSVIGNGTVDPTLGDPNLGWASPYADAPVTDVNGMPLQEAYGDPMQAKATQENANLINTANAPSTNGLEWSQLNQEDPGQLAVMKKAIVNAFRVVLLSPRKDLRWNAVHYQDISHIPAEVDDPAVYWKTLEKSRQDWNESRGYDRFSHVPYSKLIPTLTNIIYQKDYMGGWDNAVKRTEELIADWRTEEENKIMREDAEKPEGKRREGFQVEAKANQNLTKRLKVYIAESKPNLDKAITKQVKMQLQEEPLDTGQFMRAAGDWLEEANGAPSDKTRYGAFMGNHLKAVAAISQHVDDILKAALADVHEHDGTGHHFRAVCLQLGLPGVGPKVCSFAWLLLQPMTSQLATIDTHMMDLLGHQEKEMNNRDYFGMERELQAGRDAAGYGHVPLGQFQWGMWDYKRTGAGTHQDHSAMAVLDPTPHDSIDWAAKEQPINAGQAQAWKEMWQTQPPEWWGQTQPARQQVWDDFRASEAAKVGKNKIPFVGIPADYNPDEQGVYTARLAATQLTPWFTHPQTGERVVGRPGQTLMQHITEQTGLHPTEVWNAVPDAGKF